MRFDVLTLFPEIFQGYLGQSLLKRAIQAGLVDVRLHNVRDWSQTKHNTVDDRPFGGGPGMVLKVEPIVRAVRELRQRAAPPGRLVLTTPQGRRFDQALAQELAREERLILVAGHYEGYDERIRELLEPDEISLGDYVLTGGELPALVIMDAVVRLLPGALGCAESAGSDSFAAGLLEYPQYTRPVEFEGRRVPEVLLSGHHAEIAAWRQAEARRRTAARRPELLGGAKS